MISLPFVSPTLKKPTTLPAAGLFDRTEHTPQSFRTLRVNVRHPAAHMSTCGPAGGSCVHTAETEALSSLTRAAGLLIKWALMSQRDSSCFSPAVLRPGGRRLGRKRTSHLQVAVAGTLHHHIVLHQHISSSPHVSNEPVWIN